MELDEYRLYVKETLNLYPKYLQDEFIKSLRGKDLINTNSKKKDLPIDMVDLSTTTKIEEKIKRSIDEIPTALTMFNTMEFEKGYKYSVLFRCDGLDYETIVKQINSCDHIMISDTALEEMETIPSIAYLQENPKNIKLKFIFRYDKLDPDGNPIKFKYPLIVTIFKENDLIDFRFDRLSRNLFRDNTDVYCRNILLIKRWLLNKLGIIVLNVDMQEIVESIIANEVDVVKYAQSMNSRTGGEATLKVNENYVLPILGELKKLIADRKDLFDKSPEIKELLNDFISDIEETSDLPWITLCWKKERRIKNTNVRFSFDYMNQGYTLLQYTGILQDMERMNKIVECIARNMG